MKRRILSIAFVAISTILFTSVANDNKDNPNDKCKQECYKGHKMKKSKHGKISRINPFEGIELSEAQKDQLKSLAIECKVERQKNAQDKNEKKATRHNEHKNMHKKYLEKMKQILDKEQYVQYLENIVINRYHKKGNPNHSHKKYENSERNQR